MANTRGGGGQRADLTVPAPFAELAGSLRAIGERLSFQVSSDGPAWGSGSLAARDSQRLDLDDAWGTRPLRDVWLEPMQLMMHTGDHIRAMAATIDAEGVVAATISLLRPTLEAMAVAYDLLDPDLDPDERLRRGLNLRLGSIVEQLNIVSADRHPEQAIGIRQQMHKVKVAARRHGYEWCRAKRPPAKGLTNSVWLAPRPESAQRLLVRLMGDEQGQGTAPMLHRLASAVVHGEQHGRSLFWGRESIEALPDGMAQLPIRISFDWLATLTASVVVAVDRLMLRACDVYGWSVTDWRDFFMPVLTRWRGWMRNALPDSPASA